MLGIYNFFVPIENCLIVLVYSIDFANFLTIK